MPIFPLVLAAALVAAQPRPTQMPGCHCFTQRTYDAAAPAAADPYVLATTRNSLLSAVFEVPKASLVRAEMSGAAPDDLWIAHWAAARAGVAADALLDALGRARAWRAVLTDERVAGRGGPERYGSAFREALARGVAPAELAAVAIDDVLERRLGAKPATLRTLRTEGATSAEVVVAAVAGRRLKEEPGALLAKVRAGASWGALLHAAGITPADLDRLVREQVGAKAAR